MRRIGGTGFSVMSATVDTTKPRLLRYYERLGASVVSNLSIGNTPPPSVRIQYSFSVDSTQVSIKQADRRIAHKFHRRGRKQYTVLGGVISVFLLFGVRALNK